MLENGATFVVRKPKSFLNKDLSADFKGLFKASGKMVAHALTKREDIFADGAEFLTALGLETTVEERLWFLIQTSLTRALGELLAPELGSDSSADIDGLVASLLSVEEFQVEIDFLENPEKLALLAKVNETLKAWMVESEFKPTQIENLCERLPRFFVYALHHEWRKNESFYAQIEKATEAPLNEAIKRQVKREVDERAWIEYRALLRRQVDENLFAESFGLRQIFVPLRAYYEQKENSREPREEVKTVRHVVELEEALNSFVETATGNNTLRVIAGGPGSGKSSFSKMWAAQLAERDNLQILYIPLSYLDVERELPEAIDEFLTDTLQRELGLDLPNPLKERLPNKKLVLILDGLDELAMQGKVAQDTARRWFNGVRDLIRLENKRNDLSPIFALVTGRDIIMQGVEMQNNECVFHVLPYKIDSNKAEYRGTGNLIKEDRRPLWWQKYAERTAEFDGSIPLEIKGNDFDEITSWPLLNYLLAQTVKDARQTGGRIAPDINEIYGHLLHSVYKRVWADEGNIHLKDSGLDEETFRSVLQEVALTIWQSDGSAASETAIEKQCEKVGLSDALDEFRKGAESGFARLLTAFYFRQKGQRLGERSFEFTHKSFGEYLTACRIVDELNFLCGEWEKRKNERRGGVDEEGALTAWIKVCGPQKMDYYLSRFLYREIGRRRNKAAQWQKFLVELFNHSLYAGMPMQLVIPRLDFFDEKRQSRNAELCLMASLSACAELTQDISDVEWPKEENKTGEWFAEYLGQSSLAYFPYPMGNSHRYESRLAGIYLNHMNLSSQWLAYRDLVFINAQGANFQKAHLVWANLSGADLRGADLSGADLSSANLSGADLSGADLSNADLSGADLNSTDLQGANLNKVYLVSSDLSGADFTGADLRDAEFNGVRGLTPELKEYIKQQGAIFNDESA